MDYCWSEQKTLHISSFTALSHGNGHILAFPYFFLLLPKQTYKCFVQLNKEFVPDMTLINAVPSWYICHQILPFFMKESITNTSDYWQGGQRLHLTLLVMFLMTLKKTVNFLNNIGYYHILIGKSFLWYIFHQLGPLGRVGLQVTMSIWVKRTRMEIRQKSVTFFSTLQFEYTIFKTVQIKSTNM